MGTLLMVLVAAGALVIALDQHMKLTWTRARYMEAVREYSGIVRALAYGEEGGHVRNRGEG